MLFDTLNDSFSLVKLLNTTVFDHDCFLYTVGLKNLYTKIPVKHAIRMLKQLFFEYQAVMSYAHFIIDLSGLVLRNCLMVVDSAYF